jgi:diacylglycerol diphosphate phosphatase / phosphatidate phosphatase
MPFFSRRPRATDANTSHAVGKEKHGRRGIMSSSDRRHHDGALNKRPSFGQWLKATWPDVLTMIVMGIIGLGVSLHVLPLLSRR